MAEKEKQIQAGKEKGRQRTGDLTAIGLVTAVMCVLAPFSIPVVFSPVPISLATFILYLSLYILKTRKALVSCGLYLLIGIAGLPVFSGFSGGLGKLAGPTGGYLAGFPLLIMIAGLLIERSRGKLWIQVLGLVLGTAACYGLGTVWLSAQMNVSLSAGAAMGVLPYLPGDAAKMILAAAAGPEIAKRIQAAGG